MVSESHKASQDLARAQILSEYQICLTPRLRKRAGPLYLTKNERDWAKLTGAN